MVKQLFKNLLVAQIASAAAVTICMLVDNIMIGRFLGVEAIAAYGLASPVLFIFAALGSLMSNGIQVICSGTMTKGDDDGTNRCYTASIISSLVISIVCMALIYVFMDSVCNFLGATPGTEVFEMTKKYLQGFMFGGPAFTVSQILVPYLQLSNKRGLLSAAVLTMTGADILMDILNVFVFKGGIFGMGFASALSYYVAIVIAATYFLTKKCVFGFKPKTVRMADIGKIFKKGLPIAVNQVCYTLQVYVINRILLSMGSHEGVAVYSVLSTVGSLCFAIGNGIGAVSLTIAGVFYVEEDRKSMNELVKTMMFYAILLNGITCILFIALAPWIVSMFLSADAGAMELGTTALRLFVLCLIPSGLDSSFKAYYQGSKKIWLSNIISLLQNFVYICLLAFIFSKLFGIREFWIVFLIGEVLTFATMTLIVGIKNKKISLRPSDLAFLGNDFGVADECVMNFAIDSNKRLVDAAKKAEEFCRQVTGDNSKSMKIALCIEEMGKNTIQYGFSDGKHHNLTLRVFYKGDEWKICLRDDCNIFNPVIFRENYKPDEKQTHTGLNIVFNMASDIKYVNTLGLNSLDITI